MLIRGFEKKLRKLEAKCRPPKGVFFLAWGCSEAEIEQVVTGAKDAGSVSRGDMLVRALWPGHNRTPVSRWIGEHDLSLAEFDALTAEMERRFMACYSADEWAATKAGVMTGSCNPRISKMSDTQLIATALGEPAP
jgi:hypothetical protein